MLPKQASWTFRKHFTKPSEQVADPDCIWCTVVVGIQALNLPSLSADGDGNDRWTRADMNVPALIVDDSATTIYCVSHSLERAAWRFRMWSLATLSRSPELKRKRRRLFSDEGNKIYASKILGLVLVLMFGPLASKGLQDNWGREIWKEFLSRADIEMKWEIMECFVARNLCLNDQEAKTI